MSATILSAVVALEIITYAILTRVSLTWVSRWTHEGPWKQENLRQAVLTTERHVTRVANLGEWMVRPAHLLEIRVQRHDEKTPGYAVAALFGVVTLLVSLLGGFSTAAVLLGAALGVVAAIAALALRIRFSKAEGGDTDENPGLVFDLRPVAAVFLIGLLVWWLKGL